MFDQMTIFGILSLINCLTCVSVGLFLFLKNRKSSINLAYFIFDLCIAFYAFFYFLWQSTSSDDWGVFFFKWCIVGVVLINSAFMNFAFDILGIKRQRQLMLWMLHVINAFFCYAALFLFYQSWRVKFTYGLWPVPSKVFDFYIMWWFAQVIFAFYLIYTKGILTSHGKQKAQYQWIFWATLIAYVGGATNWLVWYDINFPPYLNSGIALYALVLAYAIFRHQLLGIEVIIKRTLVFAGVFGMMMSVVAGITSLMQSYVSQFFKVDNRLSMSLSVAAAILLYDPVRKFLVEVTDRYLFQKKDDIKVILNQLAGNIIMILDISQVADKILATLRESLRLESGAIIIKDEKDKGYEVLESFNVAVAGSRYEADDIFLKYLGETKRIINLENTEEKNTLPAPILGRLQDLRAVLCIPLFIHNELIGVLTLGKKKSDEEYTSEELDYLPTVASQVSIALSNARLYEILKKSQVDFAQQAKMAAIGTLSAGISHEIKNPLNHMRLAVGMLRLNKRLGVYNNFTKDQFEGEVFNAVERIDANITRATEVIERLSSFAKKPKELKLEPVSLEKAIENAFRLLDRELEHYGIAVKRNYTADLPLVSADAHAVEDVFLNLLVNARHAIKEKGTITVGTHLRGSVVEVAIRDTGCGISPENLEKIFDPFFTTKDTTRNPDGESVKGTGLGLFIVRELIKKLGGRIDVESEVGKGTCFRVTFPVLQEELAKGA